MTFDEVTRQAAKDAESAVAITIKRLQSRHIYDEDDVTGFFIGSLQTVFDRSQIGGITLSASILRHRRGIAAEERHYGADMLIHVSMDTPTQTYSKGVLIQAKKNEPDDYWTRTWQDQLVAQCNRMLAITPSAFVFNYNERGIRCGAATRVAGAREVVSLNSLCRWTSYRFFLELFRCPIGDPRITSASVADLPVTPVPFILAVKLTGEFTVEEGSSLR